MNPRVSTLRFDVLRLALLPAAALGLIACGADPLVPETAVPARVVLASHAASALASLDDTALVTLRVLDRDGQPMDGLRLRWSVSPAGIVQQDAEGVFRAIGNGRATVVAELDPGETGVRASGYWAGRLADSVVVTVRQRAARLTLAPVDTAFATIGAARQLRASVTDARGHALLDGPPPLTWRSADASVAAVDGAGTVRSLAEGVARISVQAESLTGAATFTVSPKLPHTSCMVFAQRRQSRQACVTLTLTVREREVAR